MIVRVVTEIDAAVESVFDLARDVDLHTASMREYGEIVVAGRTSGLLEPGEEVTWQAKHFGLHLRLTSRITEFNRPTGFRDSMVRGPFARLDHDHRFLVSGGKTVMEDVFNFASPLGPIGWLVDRLVLGRYMQRLLRERARAVKEAAEAA